MDYSTPPIKELVLMVLIWIFFFGGIWLLAKVMF